MILSKAYRLKIKEALTLALPIIAGQLGQVLMGFFDTVQIGGLGHEYIAASGFANGIYWMTILLGMGILFAVSPLVSEAFGENKGYKSIGVLISSLVVSLALTVIFMIIIWIVTANLSIFRHNETDNLLGSKFLYLINYSTGFVFFFMAAKQFLDGMGKTKVGMQITIAGLVLNYFLNWVLIYGRLGLPQLGIEGAAIANGISRLAMTAAIFFFIWRDSEVRILWKEFTAHTNSGLNYIGRILTIGIPAGLQFFWEVAAFNAGQIMSGWISTAAEAAHMIAIGLASITFMVLSGVSAAGTILIGYSYGAKDKEGIRISGNTIIFLTLVIESIFAIFFFGCHSILPWVYTDNAEVIAIASSMLIFAAVFQISDGLQAVACGALRGIQDVKIPSIIAFVSYWLIMIPACYILAFPLGLGLKGIWIGFIIGLSIAAIMQLLRFRLKARSVEFIDL
ncbi:MAG: MATE family efflux transporter [Bacteroidota bacterium]